jgi:hypothetical protein
MRYELGFSHGKSVIDFYMTTLHLQFLGGEILNQNSNLYFEFKMEIEISKAFEFKPLHRIGIQTPYLNYK